jgi:hypothetical protein
MVSRYTVGIAAPPVPTAPSENNSALAEFLFALIFFSSFEQARTRSRQSAKHTIIPGGISRCVVVV